MNTEFKLRSYDTVWNLNKRRVRGCYLSKLYFISDGQTMYSRDGIEQYADDGAFHQSLESAKNYAERIKDKTIPYYIDEIPALVFQLTSWCLIITEINTSFPFDHYFENYPESCTVSGIASYFAPRRFNTIRQFFGVCREFDRPTSFRSYHSMPQNHAQLKWVINPIDKKPVETKYAEATVKRLNLWVTSNFNP